MVMSMRESKGKILVTYHKKYPVLTEDFILPIHVGRASTALTKDGRIHDEEKQWLVDNLIGDDTGDQISKRNREYSECTGLYWFWKNYDYGKLDYVGVFQYRRQLILNDLYERARENREKKVYKCLHMKKSSEICSVAGITEERILALLRQYDCIVPYRTSLEKIGIRSVYEDYMEKIPGVHIPDVFLLEDVFQMKYPELSAKLKEYLNSPNKLMYQIFITKPDVFSAYCGWLFDLLFAVDPLIDVSLYTTNGKRTMGYLAEILYGFYFTTMISQEKVLHTGVTYLE